MNKPQRLPSLEALNDKELSQKRKDIMICIRDAKTPAQKEQYVLQLQAVNQIKKQRQQLLIEFGGRLPVDDEQNDMTTIHDQLCTKLNILKANGLDRIADEIEKQITLTIKKGGMFYHIDRELDDEIEKIAEREKQSEHDRHPDAPV
jgi:hypothetical protein